MTREENSVRLPVEEALQATIERADQVLTRAPGLIRTCTTQLAGRHGKLLRARALIACAMDADEMVSLQAVPAAAAIELLHLATLVHDDVIDDASIRRGLPTLHSRFGRRAAVICGDYLLSAALRLAADAMDNDRHDSRLPDYAGRICLGELRQQVNNGNLQLSVFAYLKIISGKTAALFEAAYRAGALLSGASEREAKRYGRLGRWTGIMFQLADDCMDYEQEEITAHKPVRSDYEQGVITLPLIWALQACPTLVTRAADGALSGAELSELVRGHGGLACARRLASRYYCRAVRLIDTLAASPAKRAALADALGRAHAALGQPAGICETLPPETVPIGNF